jgi:hypothetical protein
MSEKENKPKDLPPANSAAAADASSDAPQALPPDEQANNALFAGSEQPSQTPPEESFSDSNEAYGSGVWHNNRRITGLYSTQGARNVWAFIQDMGWRRFDPSQNSSNTAFSIFAGMAKDKARNVNIRIENDRITEMYVW